MTKSHHHHELFSAEIVALAATVSILAAPYLAAKISDALTSKRPGTDRTGQK